MVMNRFYCLNFLNDYLCLSTKFPPYKMYNKDKFYNLCNKEEGLFWEV
jgi:uncharacterized protein YfeS